MKITKTKKKTGFQPQKRKVDFEFDLRTKNDFKKVKMQCNKYELKYALIVSFKILKTLLKKKIS